MKAVTIHENGGPEVLRYENLPTPEPGPGQARIRVEYAGVNFLDTMQRVRKPGPFPLVLGNEAAGVVDALGPNADGIAVGDRVAWVMQPGTYATHAIAPVDVLIPVPADIGLDIAAAVMLQGITAHHLARSTYPISERDTCLVQGGAGGVAGFITQMAKIQGARVISTVSSDAKADVARQNGADEVIVRGKQDVVAEVKRLTGGKGVDVAYDGVGTETFDATLDSVRPRGMIVLYGASSGLPAPLPTEKLSAKGSLYLTRTAMTDYMNERAELLDRAAEIFAWVRAGKLRPNVAGRYPLRDAAKAHESIAGRNAGKFVLEAN